MILWVKDTTTYNTYHCHNPWIQAIEKASTVQYNSVESHKHVSIGGVPSSCVWIGIIHEFCNPSVPAPKFCPSSMYILLEFAPKFITVYTHPVSATSLPSHCVNALLLYSSEPRQGYVKAYFQPINLSLPLCLSM